MLLAHFCFELAVVPCGTVQSMVVESVHGFQLRGGPPHTTATRCARNDRGRWLGMGDETLDDSTEPVSFRGRERKAVGPGGRIGFL